MNWTDLVKVMKDGESNTVKFFGKRPSLDDLGMTVVAMANTKSGMIFLGMDIKNYHLYGFSDTVDTLRQFIQTHCRPQINIVTDIIEKNGKDILVLRINQTANQMDNQKDNRPYYYKNMCYIMEGTTPRLALIEKSNLPLKVETQTTLDVDQQPKNSVLNTRQTEALEYIQLESSIKSKCKAQIHF